ncbi:hypothetical protein ACHAXS_003212 [Conticribra weissflogii]
MISSKCNNEVKEDDFSRSIDLRDRRGLSHLGVCLSNNSKVTKSKQQVIDSKSNVLAEQNVSSDWKFGGSSSPVHLQPRALTAATPMSVSSASSSYSSKENKAEFHRSRRAADVKGEVCAEKENANNSTFFWV